MENQLSRVVEVKYQYYAANNGLAVYLTAEEAAKIRTLPEVVDEFRMDGSSMRGLRRPPPIGAP